MSRNNEESAVSGLLSDVSAAGDSARMMRVEPEGFAKVNSNKVKLLDIFEIYPDSVQPRRAIPKSVRADWQPVPGEMGNLFNHWISLTGLSPSGYMTEDSADVRPETSDPAAVAFMALIDLAGSIHREKLANPITVVRSANGYMIETGERRWMAYHLLYTMFGDVYRQIPAREMPALDIWRQAAENNARADLTAIARARQLALLLMAVQPDDVTFQSREAFQHELGFYGQVADGKVYRIPRGSGERIVAATGLRSTSQLRDYRALLRLPASVWDAADDRAVPESALRVMIIQTRNEAELLKLVEQYQPDTVSDRDGSVQKTPTPSPAVKPGLVERIAGGVLRQRKALLKSRKKKDPETRAQLRQMAEEQRDWLSKFINSLEIE